MRSSPVAPAAGERHQPARRELARESPIGAPSPGIEVDFGKDASTVMLENELLLVTPHHHEAWQFAASLGATLDTEKALYVTVCSGPLAQKRVERTLAQRAEGCLS